MDLQSVGVSIKAVHWQKTKQRSVIFVVLYLWQGVLGKPHLDELVAPIGHIVLGAIPCGDLRKTNKQNKPQSLNM